MERWDQSIDLLQIGMDDDENRENLDEDGMNAEEVQGIQEIHDQVSDSCDVSEDNSGEDSYGSYRNTENEDADQYDENEDADLESQENDENIDDIDCTGNDNDSNEDYEHFLRPLNNIPQGVNLSENEGNDQDEIRLYENSNITVNEAVLGMMDTYFEESCTKKLLERILHNYIKALPYINQMPRTVYNLFKYVMDVGPQCPIKSHYACGRKKCQNYIGTDQNQNCDQCPDEDKKSVFYEIDIAIQIKHMFEQRDLGKKLKPFSIRDDGIITDITDGSEYINCHIKNNLQEYDLTLILNTDGLSLVKAGHSHCWPLMFTIAEVREHLRDSFLILAGIWYDEEMKPLMNTFLRPFCLEIERLHHRGVSWTNPTTREECFTKIFVPLIVADAPGIDLGTCIIPELLHSALLGVGKSFLALWMVKNVPWSIVNAIKDIDRNFPDIRPPQSFSRMPRSLQLYYKSMKGHEYMNWILLYSVPILENNLRDEYFQHWLLFVRALFLLMQERITTTDIEESNILMRLFVCDVDILYGDRNLTSNVHQMLHLPMCVQRWRPLWSTAGFVFENQNGIIACLVHSSKHQGQELANKMQLLMPVRTLHNLVHTTRAREKNVLQITHVLGQARKLMCCEDECRLFATWPVPPHVMYTRAKIRGEVYTSEAYRKTKTNSYTVEVHECDNQTIFGTIRLFFKVNNDIHFIFKSLGIDDANIFTHRESGIVISHIIPIHEDDNFRILNLSSIRSISQVVRVGNYICKRPNLLRKIM